MFREELISKIFSEVKRHPFKASGYGDLFNAITLPDTDQTFAHAVSREMRSVLSQHMVGSDDVERMYEIYIRSLSFDALVDFDAYLLYLESNRKPEERFYQPRRRTLKEVADALQDLADDKLDELFLSEPPRIGKTTMLMLFITWLIGKNSESSNLYSAYSDTITKAFYNGVLEILNDPVTYKWKDIFPKSEIASTNSAEETINLDRAKRYPSLTCRSLYGTLNGACDCNGILISDDLIGGIEEALNPDRMRAAWSKVDNNLLTRAKEKAKILWCGTRWSIIDPAGMRMDSLVNDPKFKNRRYKIINLSALNDKDESNFDYDYGVGFSTEYYHQRRASFERNNDIASWLAQYMGTPIERAGALFTPDTMRFYNGTLPDEEPDRIFMAVDPAFGGGDYVAAPVCVQYGDDIYIPDVVFCNDDKTVTQPMVASKIETYRVAAAQVEASKATAAYKEGIDKLLRDRGYRCNMTSKPAPSNMAKVQRIFDKAPDIRSRMIFVESGRRSKEYEMFMQNLFSFKVMGDNKHDDAPDSLTMAIEMTRGSVQVSVFRRPF